MSIPLTTLRGTELEVSRIGLGCNKIAAPMPDDQRRVVEKTLRQAVEAGINFFDTADVYGNGKADKVLRRVLADRRDKLIICSKAGLPNWRRLRQWQRNTARLTTRLAPEGKAVVPLSRLSAWPTYTPAHIERSIHGSLNRLGTDHLDLFLLHSPFPPVLWREDLFERLEKLKQQGKIRYYGVSPEHNRHLNPDWPAWARKRGVSALQVPVSPLRSVDLKFLVPSARDHNVGLIARQPLHKGAVFRNRSFLEIASANAHYTPAQIALRFALDQEGVDVVLAGFRSPAHLRENLGALTGPGLSLEEIQNLQALAEMI